MQATTYALVPLAKERPLTSLFVFHIFLGVITVFVPSAASIFAIIYVSYSILRIIQTANEGNMAGYVAVYIASLEMIIRVSGQSLFYEFGKYVVSLLLIIGMLVEKDKKNVPSSPVIYFVLLLPSIVALNNLEFSLVRRLVSFNLSGPLSLFVSWMYFYKRKYNKKELEYLFLNIVLPIISLIPLIFLKLPKDLSSALNHQSNKQLSGGYAPNQVATMLGYGFFIVALSLILDLRILKTRLTDIIVMFLFFGFSVLTFSRGGILTGIAAFIVSVYILIRSKRASRQLTRVFFGTIIFVVIGFFVWQLLDNITGNFVTERYERSVDKDNGSGETINTSGRGDILQEDLQSFQNRIILGSGPGGSSVDRVDTKNPEEIVNSHTEFTRMLGDHGLFGFLSLIVLLLGVFRILFRADTDTRIIIVGFAAIGLITMLHSAMRLTLPGLVIGLCMINVNLTTHPLEKFKE